MTELQGTRRCDQTSSHSEHAWPLGEFDQWWCPGVDGGESDQWWLPSVDGVAVDHDPVDHPSHYTSHPSGVECIEITRHMGFNLGNVVKYIWRAGLKDETPTIQDLEKAAWYLQDEINKRKQEQDD